MDASARVVGDTPFGEGWRQAQKVRRDCCEWMSGELIFSSVRDVGTDICQALSITRYNNTLAIGLRVRGSVDVFIIHKFCT